jgi:ribosomal-protein-alanine N-acetyltransferase
MEFYSIDTPRLTLRLLTPEVYKYVFTAYSEEQLREFLGLNEEDYAQEKDRHSKGMSTFNRSFANFQMIEKNSGKIIGWCGYHTWAFDHNRAEIGYRLEADEYKNRGFMSEALKAILHYGFTVMKLHRAEALAADYNIPSVRLLEKNNFTREGALREHYLVNGVFEESVIYSLLISEYKP